MNQLFEWLLDLDTLRLGAENVRFGFERPMPAWAWAGAFGVAALYAAWSYSQLLGARAARVALASGRALILLTLIVLVAGPRLVEREERTEKDWVIVLLDRSQSLSIEDAGGVDEPISRDEQLVAGLEASWPMWRALSEEREVVFLGVDAGAYELNLEDLSTLPAPQGRRTRLGAAVDQALRIAAARPVSALVLVSDGRSLDEPTRGAIRRLQTARAPVHVVPLGSADAAGDYAIRAADGPGVAFVSDIAPVTVELEHVGAEAHAGVSVRLIDKATGLELASERVEARDLERGAVDIALVHVPEDAGEATWIVEVVPDGRDLIAGNNRAEIAVNLIDRPLRTLYVDGYPRWEARYLKNLLLREKSIRSSNLFLAPDRRFTQEGDVELVSLPDSPEEWAEFDVVILGDVYPAVFTREQLEQLRDHVSTRGAGLVWMGGPGATPDAWWETPLAELLPFSRKAGPIEPRRGDVVMLPASLADELNVLRMGESLSDPWPTNLSDPSTGWSSFRWSQRVLPESLKPAAQALAMGAPVFGGVIDTGDASPLVLSMRYGAGRSIYVATDEIWRWRYGRGETLPERFWLPMIRLLGRESLSRTGKAAQLAVDPRRSLVDEPVRVSLELFDQSLIELGLGSVEVRLERRQEAGELAEGASVVDLTLVREPDGRGFGALWTPAEAGVWDAAPTDVSLLGLELSAEAIVALPDDELRRPETDHALLQRLAEQTGGRVFAPESMSDLEEALPNRRLVFRTEITEPLWDTPLALILILSLLSLEWVGRRLIRLN